MVKSAMTENRERTCMTYQEIQLLVELESRSQINEQVSCFDHVSRLCTSGSQWTIRIFVEPVGDLELHGESLSKILQFLLILFRSQPAHLGYERAGWILERNLQSFSWSEPAEAAQIWELADQT